MENKRQKLALVLMNLGGPDSPQAVRPFLYNLFRDKAIIPWPNPFRTLLAKFISRVRSKKAQKIYEVLGGCSPLLENTKIQAEAFKIALNQHLEFYESEVFIAMRYWHPFTCETVQQVRHFSPDKIILLPLYPQYSGTTTGSSLTEWETQWTKNKSPSLTKSIYSIKCFFDQPDFIEAHRALILGEWEKIPPDQTVRLLFSAHGLPQRNILQGDPYQWQVEQTVAAVMASLRNDLPLGTEHALCYQSKVGKLKWIGPSLDDEITRAAQDGVGVLIIPIAFVSEHSETLVELDVDFLKIANQQRVPYYGRVPTLMTHEFFIQGLVSLVINRLTSLEYDSIRCPEKYNQCACRLKTG